MAADKQMFTGAQISSVNIVTVARCGWISRGRRREKYEGGQRRVQGHVWEEYFTKMSYREPDGAETQETSMGRDATGVKGNENKHQ